MTPATEIGDVAAIEWPQGRCAVQALGAMIADLVIRLDDGREHRPLHRAPWVDRDDHGEVGLMAGLSGEWPCVPFGAVGDKVPAVWSGVGPAWEDPLPHGTGSNVHWSLTAGEEITARLELPADHPIATLERVIRPRPDGIALSLAITARRDCRLPIGLHPVFAFPPEPGRLAVAIAGAAGVWSHPATPPPDPTPVAPGRRSPGLDAVETAAGSRIDLSRLPLAEASETRLLVPAGGGAVTLTDRATGIETALAYDPQIFPAVMLWISNGGRRHAPWSGRHVALGVEPVRACFDLGVGASSTSTPLSEAGIPTALALRAGERRATDYAITARALSTSAG